MAASSLFASLKGAHHMSAGGLQPKGPAGRILRFYDMTVRTKTMQLTVLFATVVIATLIGFSSAEEEETKLSSGSEAVLTKIRSLREQAKKELQTVTNSDERDIIEAKIINEQVKAMRESVRPKRDAPKPEDGAKAEKARKARKARNARKARQVRKAQKAQKQRAVNKRQAKTRRARAQARARLIRRIQRNKQIRRSQRKTAEAKKADKTKKE
ncbi:hypothetical protein TELCIR_00747 [Teladorsagia circumcincta]|uniref:Uncharacterized protein n=1 Tax=Teladorsagia circumcincta TaxID=45464 RepID=A0A2G9V3S9_TELCI|nr:hypothetical protein TELCIR_00747 [Teladorsagia circumcincta]